ncbi:MAG: Flp family type IVb pilin [Pseudomonadota bacterium]
MINRDRTTQLARRFRRDERGATAIEYAIACAMVAIAALGGMNVAGGGVDHSMGCVEQAVTAGTNC